MRRALLEAAARGQELREAELLGPGLLPERHGLFEQQ